MIANSQRIERLNRIMAGQEVNALTEKPTKPAKRRQKVNVTQPQTWTALPAIVTKYRSTIHRAANKNIPHNLTLDHFKPLAENTLCSYCLTDTATGFDRINSNLGYTIDNITPACGDCNKMKLDTNLDQFIERVRNIYINHCS